MLKSCVTYPSRAQAYQRAAVKGTLGDTDTESAKEKMLEADPSLEMSQGIGRMRVSYCKFYNEKVSAVP